MPFLRMLLKIRGEIGENFQKLLPNRLANDGKKNISHNKYIYLELSVF
jgi:hypothetical protein